MGLVGPASPCEDPDNRVVGHIGARVLRSRARVLTGMWPPSFQTWHFGQINVPPPT